MIMLFQEIHLDSRMAIDNHIYGTTNTASSYDSNTAILNHEKKKNYYKTKKYFLLLCESCFWCASSIYIDSNINRICPVCNNINVESIPI
jgi:hypothetical protein